MENDELQVNQPDTNDEVVLDEVAEEMTEENPSEESSEDIDWKSEALKYKAIALRNKKKIEAGVTAPQKVLTEKRDDNLYKTVEELALAEKKRQFGYLHNLSPEETDAVFKITPEPTKETLEDPFVKGGLASLKAKKRVENNIPSSSSRSAFKLPEKELTNDEKQAEYEKFVQNRLKK